MKPSISRFVIINIFLNQITNFKISQNLEWMLDRTSYGDRLTMHRLVWGTWQFVADFYFNSDISWFNNNFEPGNVRFYWTTDSYDWYSPRRWRFSWTYQSFSTFYYFKFSIMKYQIWCYFTERGCQLYPQPYIFTNTTTHGLIQSPFFPEPYPVNSFCETIIDSDAALDTLEFRSQKFNLREGDTVQFLIGDSYTDEWTTWKTFSQNNRPSDEKPFYIYGSDVKIVFVTDYYACDDGYQFFWRIFKKGIFFRLNLNCNVHQLFCL